MDCHKIENQLIAYLEGELSQKESEIISNHIASCPSCQKEADRTKQFLHLLSEQSLDLPSNSLRSNFENSLAREKSENKPKTIPLNSKHNINSVLRFAASIALLISAFLYGKYQETSKNSSQLAELKTESLKMKETAAIALMENKSASKRIKGVQYIDEFSEPDPAIVTALVDRMLNDENINVRLTAVNTLQRFINSENVKEGYIKALGKEKDPGIQITIIQLLVKIQEKSALKPMQELLEEEETQPFIKEEIRSILLNTI